jgi:hypothetical protein
MVATVAFDLPPDAFLPAPFGGWRVQEGLSAFESCYLAGQPLEGAGMACELAACFDWSHLGTLLASADAESLLLSGGPAIACPPPRDLNELRYCFLSKIGLTVRSAERFCPFARALADNLSGKLGPSRVHLLATPPRAEAAWHYEDDHVFIVQTVGVKDYYFRPNTVASDVPASAKGFAAHGRETSRFWSARLRPGDVLYLPTRWWSRSCSDQDTLSLAIGVSLPTLPRGVA